MSEKIGKPMFFILNRMDENSKELADLVDKNKVIGTMPFDKDVFKACLKGEKVPPIMEMEQIAEKLLES